MVELSIDEWLEWEEIKRAESFEIEPEFEPPPLYPMPSRPPPLPSLSSSSSLLNVLGFKDPVNPPDRDFMLRKFLASLPDAEQPPLPDAPPNQFVPVRIPEWECYTCPVTQKVWWMSSYTGICAWEADMQVWKHNGRLWLQLNDGSWFYKDSGRSE